MKLLSILNITSNLLFWIKLFFILFLFFFNVYLLLKHNIEEEENLKYSGLDGKLAKKALTLIGTVVGSLSGYITIKNEYQDGTRARRIEDLIKVETQIEEAKEELCLIKTEVLSAEVNLALAIESPNRYMGFVGQMVNETEKVSEIMKEIKKESKKGNELIVNQLEHILEGMLATCKKMQLMIEENINEIEYTENQRSLNKDKNSDTDTTDTEINTDINKSTIFNLDQVIEWFEGLSGIHKLGFCMVMSKSLLFSCLLSIVFIFYGDQLIIKYKIEERYPKLATIIKLRRKFQNYYFKINCLFILGIIITEVSLGLALLSL